MSKNLLIDIKFDRSTRAYMLKIGYKPHFISKGYAGVIKTNTKVNNTKISNISDLIDITLEDLEKSKFINDKFYSESKAKSLFFLLAIPF